MSIGVTSFSISQQIKNNNSPDETWGRGERKKAATSIKVPPFYWNFID